ncbi:MAG: cyclic nucleotide-binding domain-containing protein [Planctomycetaceae bacterium]|nr:cyclic nucleotide-binding domain-containing protein [Planctomycetaceae bacterium]
MDSLEFQNLLEDHFFTDDLSESLINALAAIGRKVPITSGSVLFEQGSRHDCVYVICQGTIRLEMNVPGRGEIPILTIGAGELLGFSPLFEDQVMTARAIALEDGLAISIDAKELMELCEQNSELGYRVMKKIAGAYAKRLVATRLQLLDLFEETTTYEGSGG